MFRIKVEKVGKDTWRATAQKVKLGLFWRKLHYDAYYVRDSKENAISRGQQEVDNYKAAQADKVEYIEA